jgi:hypothetical protein
MEEIGNDNNVFSCRNTNVVLIVRKKAIVIHIIGKAFGGGCHDGRARFLNTGSSLLALGLELFNGENTLDFNDIKNIKTDTIPVDKVSLFIFGKNIGNLLMILICKKCKNVNIRLHCTKVAPI